MFFSMPLCSMSLGLNFYTKLKFCIHLSIFILASLFKSSQEFCVKSILKQLLSAVSALHKNSIIHRDIKMENILIQRRENDFQVILADFGCAVKVENDTPIKKNVGTPGWNFKNLKSN